MSTYPLPRSTHAPPPKPSAEPSKPPTSTSSLATCPNGTKIPDCSTGSPRSEAPLAVLCAAFGPRHRPHQVRWVNAVHNPALLIGLAGLPPALQHRPPCPRRGLGGWRKATGDAGPLLRRLCHPLPDPGTSRSGSGPGRRDPGTPRVAPDSPTRPGSPIFAKGRRVSTSWASTTGWSSPGNDRVVTGSTSGRHHGLWLRSEARFVR